MKKIFNEFKERKLKLFQNNELYIENYNDILKIENNTIIIDIYTIYGDFLKITRIDEFIIAIEGKINEIKITQ